MTKSATNREIVILGVLMNGDRYGRDIRNEYQKRTNTSLPTGSLYTTLDRMEEKGLLKSYPGQPSRERSGRPRRYFKITAPGRRVFNESKSWAQNTFGLTMEFLGLTSRARLGK